MLRGKERKKWNKNRYAKLIEVDKEDILKISSNGKRRVEKKIIKVENNRFKK